jgi:RNA-directed DNA polymerase
VLEGDIKGCFDHISHQWMLKNVPVDKTVLQKWLKAGYVENRNLFPTEAGTPQGGIISPTLANMTLDGLEKLLLKHFPREKWKDGKRWAPKVNLVRYADDFIITGDSKEFLENEVRPLVERFLEERGLALSADKTRITHIDEGFDFLGQNLRKYDGKPLVKPSKKNTHAFLEKVRGLIGANKTVSPTALIDTLNPVIRGWAGYHRHCVATATFERVDHEIWRRLWQWARRRHTNKSATWVKKRYFPAQSNRDWTFATVTGERTPEGKLIWKRLVYASDTKIKRHIKIRRDANPFDPQWKPYFEERAFRTKFGIRRQQAGIQPP